MAVVSARKEAKSLVARAGGETEAAVGAMTAQRDAVAKAATTG